MPKHRCHRPPIRGYAVAAGLTLVALPVIAPAASTADLHSSQAPIRLQSRAAAQTFTLPVLPLDIPAMAERLPVIRPSATPRRVALQSAASAMPQVESPSAVSRVLNAALSLRGTPYVRGGTSAAGVDCSGLVQLAYRAAGVTLPRVAADQATSGRQVSLGELQPGDLLFYYQPISHVVMFAGNGQIVEASQPGHPVAERSMYLQGFATARRIIG